MLFAYSIVLLQILGSILLSISSDLSDEDNPLCFGIFQEHFQTVYEVCAIKWITTNTFQEKKTNTYASKNIKR